MTKSGGLTHRDLWEAWGRNLRTHRERLGLSQIELAEAAGTSQAQVSAMERGISGGKDVTRFELARVLGIEVGDLFGYPTTTRAAS